MSLNEVNFDWIVFIVYHYIMEEEIKLEEGLRLRMIIENHEERNQRKVDGAKIVELRDDGDHLVKCDTYTHIANDGSGVQTEILPMSHFEGWELE
jgi:hypothetical protein